MRLKLLSLKIEVEAEEAAVEEVVATAATTIAATRITATATAAGMQEMVVAVKETEEVVEEAEADEVDSGTEADGAAEVVTTTLALPMQMVGRVADKLLPPLLLLRLLLLAERLDECAR